MWCLQRALPVLTPGVQNVGRMGKKWNRRETKRVPAASGCGQMLGEGSGRKENGRRCRRMKMRENDGSYEGPIPFGRGQRVYILYCSTCRQAQVELLICGHLTRTDVALKVCKINNL